MSEAPPTGDSAVFLSEVPSRLTRPSTSWPQWSLATLLAVLTAGCNVHGSYPDAVEPDAAKFRFQQLEQRDAGNL